MATQQDAWRPVTPWTVIAAILLPPLGVFLSRGLTPAFWLTVVLTVIGWVPGMIFALALLFVPDQIPIR
ncbi:YqaE/Pmp3 family membrane protein [Rhizorhabdus wittichii]|uniref:YqaE/Pmp3 family membrane protein n=1 Tax=Rhizorhabdus wittichii TaxID=160791 RepID=A0A975D117_9SPHN|nr:YqaE/Pmp3 family membrane protein [Rhizorhabdus wittichii]QTH20912.1 YqaE/Pmp3 family membrane protein [Rhizorhabdus wittichii]